MRVDRAQLESDEKMARVLQKEFEEKEKERKKLINDDFRLALQLQDIIIKENLRQPTPLILPQQAAAQPTVSHINYVHPQVGAIHNINNVYVIPNNNYTQYGIHNNTSTVN